MFEALEHHNVVLAGGGIAGLALARALHLKDMSCLVLERRPAVGEGLAVNLPGNAIAALTALGLGEEIQRHGAPNRRREYRTSHGRLLFAIDEDAFWGPAMSPRCVLREDLLSILGADLPIGTVRRGVEVSSIAAMADGVRISLGDHMPITARFLVGADGVGSVVRRAMASNRMPTAARLAAASWRFIGPNPGVDCWTLWAGRDAMLLLIPVASGRVYGWASATRDRTTSPDIAVLAPLFRAFSDIPREAIDQAVSNSAAVHHSPLEEVRLDRWAQGRMLLIGDAAHATAPVWAQGAAMAMEDALGLAEVLNEETDLNKVGMHFQKRRRPRVDHVQSMTDAMSKAARLPIWLRNLVMPVVGPKKYRQTYELLKERGDVAAFNPRP